jgi:DNA-binding Lrp family transcriptional regulator
LDELDIRLLKELTHGANEGLAWGDIDPSYRRLGKRLGVSKGTVRNRLEGMSKSRFLKVFPVQVNPSLLGMKVGVLSLDVPVDVPRAELLEQLSLIDGVLLIAQHVGGMVGLSFYYEDEAELDKKVQLVTRICKATGRRFTETTYPPCALKLSVRDWKIMAALQRRRKETASEIAEELGISTRTLKRRTKRMIEGMAISTLISTDLRALRGAVVANLLVDYDPAVERSTTDRTLLRELDSNLIYAGLWTRFSIFTLVFQSIPLSSETLKKVRRMKGVVNARLDLLEERVEVYSTLAELVESKLKSIIEV